MTTPDVSQADVEALCKQLRNAHDLIETLSDANAALRERAEIAERRYAETNAALVRSGRLVGTKIADVLLLTDERDALRAKLAECEKDAERYKWLRTNDPSSNGKTDEEIDKLVDDAALASQGGEKP